MEKNRNEEKRKAIGVIVAFSFLIVFVEKFVIHYKDIDNFILSNVLNCVYSDKYNFALYVHPLLSGLIKILHKAYAYADWYLVITEMSVLFSFFCLCLGFVQFVEFKLKHTVIIAALFSLFLIVSDVFHSNFTITTGYLNCAAILLLAFWFVFEKKYFFFLAGIMYLISWMFRTDACLLLTPYLVLVLVCLLFGTEIKFDKKRLKKVFAGLIYFASIACLMMVSKRIYINSTEYKEAEKYNQARVQIADYCEDGEDVMHILMDTDNVTEEYLKNEYDNKYCERRINQELFEAITSFARLWFEKSYTTQLFAYFLLILLLTAFSSKGFAFVVYTLMGLLGGSVISSYFALQGRMLDRVGATLMLGCLTVNLTCILTRKVNVKKQIARILLIVYFVSLFTFSFDTLHFSRKQNVLLAMKDNEYNVTNSSELEDGLFVWDVYSFDQEIMRKIYWSRGKLFSEELISKNVIDGEWVYGQPYFNDYLYNLGLNNPMKALFAGNNIYYIGSPSSLEVVLNYYDPQGEYATEAVGRAGNLYMYHFYKNNGIEK